MMVDLRNRGLTGKEVSLWLDAVDITANKNTVPDDPQSPFVTSGIRLGTPALTTRGMKEDAMQDIARIIADVISTQGRAEGVKSRVKQLTDRYPLYPELLTRV